MTKILIIDNHDSFTHILADLVFRAVGIQPEVVRNNQPRPEADLVIISPGPGHPAEAADIGSSRTVLAEDTPVIGICLGHQAIALAAGCTVDRAQHPKHGLSSEITHDGSGFFAGLPSPLQVIRYHSLDVRETEASRIEVLARAEDGTIMALRRTDKPQWGLQFHPESIGTEHGVQLMRQLIDATGVIPTWRRRRCAVVDPAALVAAMRREHPVVCWLDSSDGSGMHLIGAGSELVSPHQIPVGILSSDSDPAPVTFVPGAMGVLPYEATAGIDGGEFVSGSLLVPKMVYQLIDDAAWLISQDDSALPELTSAPSPARIAAQVEMRHSRADYRRLIAQCQEAIAAGDSYELCLTTSARASYEVDPLALYLRLREVAPAPMAGLFLGEVSVLSSSPERFLSIRNGTITANPIKGTRRRGASAAEDTALVNDLKASVKDRAENLMIVDLLRNDLSRSCAPGSIHVAELCQVYTFSQAHQLVSTIVGQLEADPLNAMRAAFPGGSMTGAPKQRSMDILAELEEQPRGYYSGCMGYISASGEADWAILIRTVVQHGSQLSYGAGGAITALSDPDEEYDEVLVKMQPFRLLLES
ncbi:chorismate-binding protein [Corynebacterium sp. H128]|uniref:chorismate-binding protein n=1 Tax=Corynebacterium sp. H128 TaxID=3133427 RepID=UPI0030A03E68